MRKFVLSCLFICCLAGFASGQAPIFTFECKCDYLSPADTNCDICNTSVLKRHFSGLLIRKNGAPFKWIDEPYTVRQLSGENVLFIEQIPTPDQITIARFQTQFATMADFLDSTICQCSAGGTTYIAGPGIVISGDTISAVDTSFLNELQYIDTFAITGGVLYISLSQDSVPALPVTLPVPDGSETKVTAGTGISVTGSGTIASPYVVTNTAPDQVVSIAGAGINVVTGTYPSFTVTGTEVDGSITNEGLLGVGAGGSSSSVITSNTSGAVGVTINVSGILTISESTSSNGGSITLTATEVDGSTTNELQTYSHAGTTTYTNTLSGGGGSWSITGGGIAVISQTGGAITVTATEVDGNISNEGSLTVGAGTGTTSIINSNTSGSTGVTITAGSGLGISETGNVITLTNTAPDQTVSITGAGINVVTGTYPNFTITGTEVDGSVTNEAQTLSASGTTSGIITLSTAGGSGGGTVTIAAGSGIGVAQSAGTITISNTASSNAYVNGGNSFGAAATIGLNDNFDWSFETNGTNRMWIDNTGPVSIGATQLTTAALNVNGLQGNIGMLIAGGGTLTGPNFYQATGSGTGSTATVLSGVLSMISGNVETIMNNTATAGTNGGALFTVQVSATASTNDAFIKWVSGAVEWSFGPDNDDVDNMKLHRFARPSSNNGQGTIEIGYRTNDIGIAINKVGIGITTNGFYGIDVGGKVRFDQYACNSSVLNGATVATLALGTAAGTSPTIDNTVTDVWGNGARLKFTSGTSPTANGVICTITLDTNYTFNECASGIWARSTNAAGFGYSSSFNSATRVITFTLNGTLTASTVYEFNILFNGQN